MYLKSIALLSASLVPLAGCDKSWERAFANAANSSSVQNTLNSTYAVRPSYDPVDVDYGITAYPEADPPVSPLPSANSHGSAAGSPSSTHSTDAAGAAKSVGGFGPILKEEKLWTGFSPEEVAAAERLKQSYYDEQEATARANREKVRLEGEALRQKACSENPKACKSSPER